MHRIQAFPRTIIWRSRACMHACMWKKQNRFRSWRQWTLARSSELANEHIAKHDEGKKFSSSFCHRNLKNASLEGNERNERKKSGSFFLLSFLQHWVVCYTGDWSVLVFPFSAFSFHGTRTGAPWWREGKCYSSLLVIYWFVSCGNLT